MLKKITNLLAIFILICSSIISVYAEVKSVDDINTKIEAVQQVCVFNFRDYTRKTELIGQSLEMMDLYTNAYKKEAIAVKEHLYSIVDEINLIQQEDLKASEKQIKINKLYKDVEIDLNRLDARTIQYLYSIQYIMPSITYQRFVKKFKDFYNSLYITD